jgi:hypothetical protein
MRTCELAMRGAWCCCLRMDITSIVIRDISGSGSYHVSHCTRQQYDPLKEEFVTNILCDSHTLQRKAVSGPYVS